MLSRHTIELVQQLLATGDLSQREIARRLKIGRGTVNAIANGRRKPRDERPIEDELKLFSGPAMRCPECGGMVYQPCLLCEIRRLKREERPAPRLAKPAFTTTRRAS